MADSQLISILLPVHNGFPFLPQAIESIVNQTEQRWKLIVVNDGSTDGTKEYLDSLADPRIHTIHQENQGLSASLNRGLDLCSTPFIARMDGDDISYPTRLEKQLAFMEANPKVGLLGTQIRRVGSKRSGKGSKLPTRHANIVDALMKGKHGICHPSIMCRTSVFEQVGKYASGLGEEWDLFLRFGEKSELANLQGVMLGYRYHAASINGSRMAELRRGVRYRCECSRRRLAEDSPISFEDFARSEKEGHFVSRFLRNLEDYSRSHYHSAVGEILGEHPIQGYARLGFAALSAPHLAIERVFPKLETRPTPVGKSQSQSAARKSLTEISMD